MAEETDKKEQQTSTNQEEPSIVEENITVAEKTDQVIVDQLKSTTVPEATDMATSNAPDPTALNPEVNPNAAKVKTDTQDSKPTKQAKKPPVEKGNDEKPAAKAPKKEKAPAVEDKPFIEFVEQDYLSALKKALASQGVKDLQLSFAKDQIPVKGYEQEQCWQVMGSWENGLRHQFNIYFPEENIQGQRAFSCNEGTKPSDIEPFLIDERKVTLDLLVFGVIQRLDGQKWLGRN